jgi:hypothetical protein
MKIEENKSYLMFEDYKIFNFFKTVILLEALMYSHIFLRCSLHVPAFQRANSQTNWGDPDVDRRIILRGIFMKWEGVVGNGWSGLRIGTGRGHL